MADSAVDGGRRTSLAHADGDRRRPKETLCRRANPLSRLRKATCQAIGSKQRLLGCGFQLTATPRPAPVQVAGASCHCFTTNWLVPLVNFGVPLALVLAASDYFSLSRRSPRGSPLSLYVCIGINMYAYAVIKAAAAMTCVTVSASNTAEPEAWLIYCRPYYQQRARCLSSSRSLDAGTAMTVTQRRLARLGLLKLSPCAGAGRPDASAACRR